MPCLNKAREGAGRTEINPAASAQDLFGSLTSANNAAFQ